MKSATFASAAIALVIGAAGCVKSRPSAQEQTGGTSEAERTPRDRSLNEQDRAGAATLTGARLAASDDPEAKIVASRCAREVDCSNVGAGRHFADGERCLSEVQAFVHDAVETHCPNGIAPQRLDRCLDVVRNATCTTPVAAIGHLLGCRKADLCPSL